MERLEGKKEDKKSKDKKEGYLQWRGKDEWKKDQKGKFVMVNMRYGNDKEEEYVAVGMETGLSSFPQKKNPSIGLQLCLWFLSFPTSGTFN